MVGSRKKIDVTKPGLAVTAKTTPVIAMDGDQRFQIDWDFGNLRTINLDQAKRLLDRTCGDMKIVARLREVSAIGLRQQLLSNIGRVGELAFLPRSMKFQANFYLPLLQKGDIRQIIMPDGVVITGNILISRRWTFASVIFDSNCEDDVTTALRSLNLEDFAGQSKKKLDILREQTRLWQIFRSGFQGVTLPLDKPRDAGLLKLDEPQPDSDDRKPNTDKVATVLKGKDEKDIVEKLGKNLSKAGLIVQIHIDDVG